MIFRIKPKIRLIVQAIVAIEDYILGGFETLISLVF